MELKFVCNGLVGIRVTSFELNLYGIEIMTRPPSMMSPEAFELNLYGIEILLRPIQC